MTEVCDKDQLCFLFLILIYKTLPNSCYEIKEWQWEIYIMKASDEMSSGVSNMAGIVQNVFIVSSKRTE